jgi:hypothetical protein
MAFAATMRRLRAAPVALFASALLSTVGCSDSGSNGPGTLPDDPGDTPGEPGGPGGLPLDPPPASGGTTGGGTGGIGGAIGGIGGVGGAPGFDPGFAGGFANRPVDERPVIISQVPPRAIQGGTLAISRDDRVAVVGDPDRDRIVMVDLFNGGVLGTLSLAAGAEPGRVIFDADNRAHIALRGSGELATLDVATREIIEQREVCGVPSGLAYDEVNDTVLVACQGGELVTMPAAGGAAVRTVNVEQDIRDVVIKGSRVFVTSFKRAELLELNAAGAIINREAPVTQTGSFFSPVSGGVSPARTLEPAVAWRAVASPTSDSIRMVHQRAQLDEIDIGLGHGDVSDEEAPPPDPGFCEGDCGFPGMFPGGGGDNGGYGSGGASCDSIVETGLTEFGGDGTVKSSSPLVGTVLPVDGAFSPDGRFFAVAVAGSFEDQTFFFSGNGAGDGLGVVIVDESGMELPPDECLAPGSVHPGGLIGSGQSVAVAYDSAGMLVVQTRDPNRLRVYEAGCTAGCVPALDISLGGEARRDTGHDIFHANAGGGLACASCHPGGGDDGRTWLFKDLGPRRTQLFTMGIKGTEPLHWDGDLPTLSHLVGEVFVKRMGGAPQTEARVGALDSWMNTLAPLPAMRASNDAAAIRGKELFESSEVECTTCHVGEKLTNNKSVDVGTGGAFQVPSLIGVAYHAPFIHTGCAKTLHDRFDASCGGGDLHGKTSHLAPEQIDDLVAYLETL